jgi:hypothetical protein
VPAGFDPAAVPRENEDGLDLRLDGDRTWTAGADAVAGPYRSLGRRADETICSWSVAEGVSTSSEGNVGSGGRTVASGVTILPDVPLRVVLEDGQVLSTGGCEPWIYYGP